MQRLSAKLKYIFLPFFAGSLLMVGGYAFVRWLVDVQLGMARVLTREMWEFYVPVGLVVAFIMLAMRGRFLLLRPVAGKGKWRDERRDDLIFWLPMLFLFVVMISSQKFIASQSRDLVRVDSLSAMGEPRPGDCYIVPRGIVPLVVAAGFLAESRTVPERYGPDKLDLNIYAAIPLREVGFDSESALEMLPTDEPDIYTVLPPKPCHHWLVKKYTARVEYPSEEAVEREYNRLWAEMEEDLESGRFRRFDHLSVAPYSAETRPMLEAIGRATVRAADPVMLVPEYKPFERRMSGLWWALGSYAAAVLAVLIITLAYPPVSERGIEEFKARAALPWREKLNLRRWLFAARKGGIVTWALAGVNILVFIGMVVLGYPAVSPSPAELYDCGGVTVASVVDSGEWWRMFTSMFVHGGVFHLLYNMVALVVLGLMIEPIFKSLRFAAIYLAAGLGGFAAAACFTDAGTVMAGASGAIFGIMGAMGSVWIRARKKYSAFPLVFLCFGGVSLLWGAIAPGISNSAHIGGLLTGFVLGFLLHRMPRRGRKRPIAKQAV